MQTKWILKDLINITKYCYHTTNEMYDSYLRKYEKDFYSSLSTKELIDLANLIKSELDITLNPFIKDDITLNEKQIIFKRIYNKVIKELKKRTQGNGIIRERDIIDNIEARIRNIFCKLLKKHIDNSNNQSSNYKNILSDIIDNLRFTYKDVTFNKDIRNINTETFYIEKLIITIINKILLFNDEDFQDEKIYAYIVAYQTVLRSLFLLLNNKNKLEDYREYIIKNIRNNNQAKNIILTAIVANNHDIEYMNKVRRYTDD